MSRIFTGPEAIAEGIARLNAGRPVAFPTETVYGLGADALDPGAVQAVFTLKGRPTNNPLIVHVSGIDMARSVVAQWTEQADAIARAHWPGPVTVVLPKDEALPDIVCASGDTVAIRCPAHPVALALIEAFGKPIVGPSANPSGRISPTTPEHVADGFPDADLVIIDGGACHAGIESTVIDLTDNLPCILRQGVVGSDALGNTLGVDVRLAPCPTQNAPARSPGLLGPHYQPRTPCRLVGSDQLSTLTDREIALIAWSTDEHPASGLLISMERHAEAYAAGLYAAMHRADASGGREIWIETPPTHNEAGKESDAIWNAVLERVARATQSG